KDGRTEREGHDAADAALTPGSGLAAPHPAGRRPESRAEELLGRSLIDPETSQAIDRKARASLGRLFFGLSPVSIAIDYFDWLSHLALAPGKQARMAEKGLRKAIRLGLYASESLANPETPPCIRPLPQDRRFENEAWRRWPHNLIYQAFLLNQQWWHNATTGVRGVTARHENLVQFMARQVLDMCSPTNFPLTNPEVLQRTLEQNGANLVRGMQHLSEDFERQAAGKPPAGAEDFVPGVNVAVTPGKVVLRNQLIELIQYQPATDRVRPEPVLIVPAWIMKYYILDLSPHNSLVRYLTEQGYTVFMVSWKNPDPGDREIGLDDYRTLGVMAALDAIGTIVPGARVHATGYCLGGTLLAIAAATMAREGDERLRSISLFAAQMDFTEAGELTLFIDESQLTFLEDLMWEQGFLDTSQMAGAFQTLRSNDLVWSRIVRDYLMGERRPMTDLMAWNADATRMPYRMHSEYLRQLFLSNELAEGRFTVEDRPIALTDIRAPIFAVGTEHDHVAPWRSAYKVHLLTDTAVTFVLASGGHNTGIVAEPGHPRGAYRVMTNNGDERYVDPESWIARADRHQGSWWSQWIAWLGERSTEPAAPPPMGAPEARLAPLAGAPGTYVLQR
ncbi:MAG: polyhydroxyalkanoic acid synthase, partial [Burkholderiales bacterium]